MLDVESQEGIFKTLVKLVVHSFMENGTSTESQLREEETNETNDQSEEEEEELCPPLEETMAASWIAQIGEEDLSEIEAVDSFIAMNDSVNELGLRLRCSRRRLERIVDSSHHVQEFETEEMLQDR